MLTSVSKRPPASMLADEADFDRKGIALTALSENCGKPMSVALSGIWMTLLEPYTAKQVEAGVNRIIGTWRYKTLPTFAELKEAIHEACGLPAPDSSAGAASADLDAEAEAAWAQVFGQIREVGSYGRPALDAAQEHAVRVCGGWQRLCECTRADLQWQRRTFAESYKRARTYGSAMDEGPGAVRRAVEARRQARALPGGAMMIGQEEE